MYIYSHQLHRSCYDLIFCNDKLYVLKPEYDNIYIFSGISQYINTHLKQTDEIHDKDIIYTDNGNFQQALLYLSKLSTQHKLIVDTAEGMLKKYNVPQNIRQVYSPVPQVINDIYKPFPRGWLFGGNININSAIISNCSARNKLVLARWNKNNLYGNRQQLWNYCANQNYITTKDFIQGDIASIDYYKDLFEHKYCICPLGNATSWQPIFINETYRQWEAIRCGCIPIVLKCNASIYFNDVHNIPMLLLNSWNELSQELLNDNYDTLIQKLDLNKITYNYWNRFIRNYN